MQTVFVFDNVMRYFMDLKLCMSACDRSAVQPQSLPGQPPHFFSLLKEIICGEPEGKISLTKV